LILAFPGAAAAVITGGCTGEGHATSGSADITTQTEWHILSTDVGGGSGTAPAPIKAASVGAYAGGLSIPIASSTSEDGETAGSVDGVSASTLAVLGARFVIAGSGSGDANCSGNITIIIDDVNPLLTVLGGGGLLLAILGLLAIVVGARSSGGLGARILATVLGGLGGLGLGLSLEQFGVLDPMQPISLVIAVIAAVLGLVLCGRFGPGRVAAPA
jgi:hypothetical protein